MPAGYGNYARIYILGERKKTGGLMVIKGLLPCSYNIRLFELDYLT
jgi:hypothetical protein